MNKKLKVIGKFRLVPSKLPSAACV